MTAVFVALAFSLAQQDKPASIFRTVFPHPTGNNGYEEYCRAADFANSPEIVKLAQQAQTAESANLKTRLALANACSPLFELVRNGNAKPAFDPRPVSIDLGFPQLAAFKSIAKIYADTIYARTASGNASAAADLLADGLTFSRKVCGGTLISYLVHAALNAILYRDFEMLMPAMGVRSCDRIIALCDDLLAQESPLVRAFEGERQFVRLAFADPKSADLGDSGFLDDEALRAEWKAMSAADRERLSKQVIAAQDKNIARAVARLKDPESTWDTEPEEDHGTGSLADVISDTLAPVYSQVFAAEGKRRTQLRLLRLHAAIQKFRWENLALPGSLAMLPKALTADPVGNGTFTYETNGKTYELYSQGYKSTGAIHLRYRKAISGGEAPPPLR